MRIHQLGEGTPEVAVVGGIHGDEPCGPGAVERLAAEEPDVARPVKLVVANEEAIDAGARYLDEDLNRAFPGDANGDTHESRLAYHLGAELSGCTVLALHSTQSTAETFAICETVDEIARATIPRLSVGKLLATGRFAEGRLVELAHTIEVECGLQGSEEAAENAYRLSREFLAATGVLPGVGPADVADGGAAAVGDGGSADPDGSGARGAPVAGSGSATERANGSPDVGGGDAVEVFRLRRPVPKPAAERYEVYVENFAPVDAGERFARADDRVFTADEPFRPVLMSPYGYAELFGYAAEHVGTL